MQEAEDAYHKAINIDPNFAMTYYNLGVLLQAQGRAQEAEEAFRLAIAKDPNHSNAYSYLGQLLKSQGRLQEADAVNRQAIEHNPENITAYYDLIRIKILEGETDNALDYLMKVTNKEDFSPAWAWRDPELENLRQDSRFEEIVGPNPKILDKSVNPPQ